MPQAYSTCQHPPTRQLKTTVTHSPAIWGITEPIFPVTFAGAAGCTTLADDDQYPGGPGGPLPSAQVQRVSGQRDVHSHGDIGPGWGALDVELVGECADDSQSGSVPAGGGQSRSVVTDLAA